MQHEVFAARGFVDEIFYDGKFFEVHGHELGEDVVVITPKVDDLGVFFLELFENEADEAGVAVGPAAGLFELPRVDDVAVEDEAITARVLEKVIYLANFAVVGPEVDVGDDDGFEFERLKFHRGRGCQRGPVWQGSPRFVTQLSPMGVGSVGCKDAQAAGANGDIDVGIRFVGFAVGVDQPGGWALDHET